MERPEFDTKRPAVVFDGRGTRVEMVHVDCVLVEKQDLIDVLKILDFMRKKLNILIDK